MEAVLVKNGLLKESFGEENQIKYVNNHTFYSHMSALDFLRDIGKHFRVSQMMARESVKARMGTTDTLQNSHANHEEITTEQAESV